MVYGVEIPGEEGRAGMAAIHCEKSLSFDINKLAEKLKRDLPSYSMPLFIRLVQDIERTGTFKAKKMKLVEQAFNITAYENSGEQTFYYDTKEKAYKELNITIYQNVINGNMRF